MAKIRTIKPEFFRHHDLFLLEQEHKLPMRIAFAGLWTCCDREGRFKWQPPQIKLDTLPYDEVDINQVLAILVAEGYVQQYEVDGKTYGFVVSFKEHQRVRPDEAESKLPAPPDTDSLRTRNEPVTDTLRTRTHADTGSFGSQNGHGNGEDIVSINDVLEHHETTDKALVSSEQDITLRVRNELVTDPYRGSGSECINTTLHTATTIPPNPPLPDSPENGQPPQPAGIDYQQKNLEKNGDAAPPPQNQGRRLTQIPLQTNGSGSFCLSFFSDDSFTAKEIIGLLNASNEFWYSTGQLHKESQDFQQFVIEHFIQTAIDRGEDLPGGALRKQYVHMVNNKFTSLKQLYGQRQRTDQWFRQEFAKFKVDWPEQEVDKFVKYYCNKQPGGDKRYERPMFEMAGAVGKWQENLNRDKKREVVGSNGLNGHGKRTNGLPPIGASIDEKKAHYSGSGRRTK